MTTAYTETDPIEQRIHILSVGGVIRRIGPMCNAGWGKKRAWCGRCRQLKDRTRFHECRWQPHPDSETGLYYEPWREYICHDCIVAHRKEWSMSKREYFKRLKKTMVKAWG